MKVAVTSTAASLDAQVDPRFGRCKYFMIVETDDMSFESLENPNVSLGGGAGIQAGQFVASNGAQVILTGNCGPNAYQTLSASGIQVIVGVSGTVREAVEAYKKGEFSSVSGANVQSHFGLGAGAAAGLGRGMGQGMGRGMGQGMGRGMGRGMGMQPRSFPGQASEDDDITALKEQAEALQTQAEQIFQRIRELEERS